MTSITRTMAPPSAPSGMRRQKVMTARAERGIIDSRRSAWGCAMTSTWFAISSPSRVPDPRIEHRVEEVHDQVQRDDDRDDQKVDPLDHRVVALEDGVEEKASHAGQAEDGLDDH